MKVISRKQIPTSPHWGWKALTAYLALEHFNAPGWIWGVVGCIFVLALIGHIYYCATRRRHTSTSNQNHHAEIF